MSVIDSVEGTMPHIPLWGWGALAGGGLLIYLYHKHNAAAAAIVDPNNQAPLASAVDAATAAADPSAALDTITAQGQADALRIGAAGTVAHQTAQDQLAEAQGLAQDFSSIFQGGFLPSNFTVSTPSGYDITVDNSGAWTNELANTQGGWANQLGMTQGAWQAAIAHDANYYQTLQNYQNQLGQAYANWIAAGAPQNAYPLGATPAPGQTNPPVIGVPPIRLFCGPGDPGCQSGATYGQPFMLPTDPHAPANDPGGQVFGLPGGR